MIATKTGTNVAIVESLALMFVLASAIAIIKNAAINTIL
jgi:hypothetical protein